MRFNKIDTKSAKKLALIKPEAESYKSRTNDEAENAENEHVESESTSLLNNSTTKQELAADDDFSCF